jgi:hypothetical protein
MTESPIELKELSIKFATPQTTVFRGVALPHMYCGQVIIEHGMVLESSTITQYETCMLVAQSGATMVRTHSAVKLMVAGDTALVSTPFQLTNINAKKMPTSIVYFAMSDAINHNQPIVDNRSIDNDNETTNY